MKVAASKVAARKVVARGKVIATKVISPAGKVLAKVAPVATDKVVDA